ncbi:unnamed protein product [marine sediment metagenome]|uniref:Uncharacterized protein n=1 Tax=marine sediment metagenome TaxID=412755 RepID=X1U812_9ZZZZ
MSLVSEVAGTSNFPEIAFNPLTGDAHFLWTDYTNYLGCGTDADIFHRVLDVDTLIWSTLSVVSTESTDNSIKPKLAFDNEGKAHVVWRDATDYGGSGTDFDVFYKSYDQHLSIWTLPEIVSTESTSNPSKSAVVSCHTT